MQSSARAAGAAVESMAISKSGMNLNDTKRAPKRELRASGLAIGRKGVVAVETLDAPGDAEAHADEAEVFA